MAPKIAKWYSSILSDVAHHNNKLHTLLILISVISLPFILKQRNLKMFVFPYDTTVCADHLTSNLIKIIKTTEAIEGLTSSIQLPANDSLANVKLNENNVLLVTAKNKDVPPFAHPILVDFVSGKKIVVDARPFTKLLNNDVVITSDNEYKFSIIRAALIDCMANGSIKDIQSLGSFPLLIFSRWIAENLTKRLGLNPREQALLVVISAFYYSSLFREDPVFNDVELSRQVQLISKITYIPVDLCQEVADKILPMSNIKEFVSQTIAVIESPRLEKFSTGLMLTILMNSWYGLNSKEIVCVALENPPTWLALVYSALNDRSYRTSGLAKVVIANDKKDMGKHFSLNLLNLVS